MDGVARVLDFGMLCYLPIDWLSFSFVKPNHKSLEKQEVKAVLCRLPTAYFRARLSGWIRVFSSPSSSMPKKGPNRYSKFADAKESNKSLADWGKRMHTRKKHANELTLCAIEWGHDIKHFYDVAVLSWCMGELEWGWSVTGLRRS
jgi:hypothetical protein